MKKHLLVLLAVAAIGVSSMFTASADTTAPYQNYVYSESGVAMEGPQAYLPEREIFGQNLPCGAFSGATDMDTDTNGDLYILDAGNNRIVVLNKNLEYKKEIPCILKLKDGANTLSNAQGIAVSDKCVYVCDTDNSRVLGFDKYTGKLSSNVGTPKSKSLSSDFVFKPYRLDVDAEENLYIVSQGTYEGIVNVTPDGEFLGFFASNKVTSSAWDLFWRRFSSVEQRKTMLQLIPQDFSSIDKDEQGFFLVTTYTGSPMVKRVNPGGNDVLRALSSVPITGDPYKTYKGTLAGVSSFADVASGPEKIYAALDRQRGRIFCYNNDGYLIYTFGILSDRLGGFMNPIAITYLDDAKVAVLDMETGSITVFAPTEYGKAINLGIHYNNRLDYKTAEEQWKYVLKQNSNYDMAINMIGNSYYNSGNYKEAMNYFKRADNKEMYSASWQKLRSEYIYNYIEYAIYVIAAIILLIMASRVIKKVKSKKISK